MFRASGTSGAIGRGWLLLLVSPGLVAVAWRFSLSEGEFPGEDVWVKDSSVSWYGLARESRAMVRHQESKQDAAVVRPKIRLAERFAFDALMGHVSSPDPAWSLPITSSPDRYQLPSHSNRTMRA